MNIFKRIFSIPYEKRTLYTTSISLLFSVCIAIGKILIGAFSDVTMCAVGVFNILLITAKSNCVIGAFKSDGKFKRRNTFIAIFLFLSGAVYTAYMVISLVLRLPSKRYGQWQAIIVATIAFVELGMAIYGLNKTKRRGHYFRNIKIIGLVSALVAIMTAQTAILSFTSTSDMIVANSSSGIGLGVLTMLFAVFVYFAPRFSPIDREHNVFRLSTAGDNKLIDMSSSADKIIIVKSKWYGDYAFDAKINGDVVDGHIVRERGAWKGLSTWLKVLFIILSEILIFVWAIGYCTFFIRSADVPNRLIGLMGENGFEVLADENTELV